MRHDDDDILQDGQSVRVPLMMRDGADDDAHSFLTDGQGHMLTDAFGAPLSPHYGRKGYAFVDGRDNTIREQNRDLRKAELSVAWRGGLALGDEVTLGGQRMQVAGNSREGDKPLLSDASTVDASTVKRAAYEAGVAAMTDAWRTRPADAAPGYACTTADGKQGKWTRGKGGALVCMAQGTKAANREFEVAGPLSDRAIVEQLRADGAAAWEIEAAGQPIRDGAWKAAVDELSNAWRK